MQLFILDQTEFIDIITIFTTYLALLTLKPHLWRHICALIMLSASLYATPVRWMDYLCKGEVLTNTNIVHKSVKVLDLMKNGGKTKVQINTLHDLGW